MHATFLEFLVTRDVGSCLDALRRLWEQNGFVDKSAYNQLFDRQLADLLRRVNNPAQRNQLEPMLGFDWMGDIERAVRRAGFGNEAGEIAHDIVVKLLVSPGGLFAG